MPSETCYKLAVRCNVDVILFVFLVNIQSTSRVTLKVDRYCQIGT